MILITRRKKISITKVKMLRKTVWQNDGNRHGNKNNCKNNNNDKKKSNNNLKIKE